MLFTTTQITELSELLKATSLAIFYSPANHVVFDIYDSENNQFTGVASLLQ